MASSRLQYLTEDEPAPAATPAPKKSRLAELTEDDGKTGILEAIALGGAQGGNFGLADELTGVVGAIVDNPVSRKIREFTGIAPPYEIPQATTREGVPVGTLVPQDPSALEVYQGARDSGREALGKARDDRPGWTTGAEIVASIANPLKVPIKGKGILAAGARAGAEGAAYAAGSSEAKTAGQFVGDVTKGTLIGFGAGTAGAAAGEGVKYLAGGKVDKLRTRILNEFAEGESKTTKTQRKHLDKAGDAIVDEVITGPDSNVLREVAFEGNGTLAREKLRPVIDSVKAKLDEGYEAFETAGKSTIDTGRYEAALEAAWRETKKLSEKRGLEKVLGDFRDLVSKTEEKMGGMGPARAEMGLRDLRAFTTEIEGYAASAIGSLNEHAAAKLKNKLSSVATGIMDDMLDAAVMGDGKLQTAANQIPRQQPPDERATDGRQRPQATTAGRVEHEAHPHARSREGWDCRRRRGRRSGLQPRAGSRARRQVHPHRPGRGCCRPVASRGGEGHRQGRDDPGDQGGSRGHRGGHRSVARAPGPARRGWCCPPRHRRQAE